MTVTIETKNATSHLYIHVPFCEQKCPYCDFYSVTGSHERMEPYIDAITREIGTSGCMQAEMETVYIGGGTPAILSPRLIKKLAAAVRPLLSHRPEVTMEANPLTISRDKAECLIEAGINRISLGVQSFQPALRKNLGRQGCVEDVYAAIEELRRAGFENISIDLIFGIPGQEMEDIRHDVEKALSLELDHISYYELTVKQTKYAIAWANELNRAAMMNAGFYEYVVEKLEQASHVWYETSNFARLGSECRHNIAYWNGADYIGIGASAWSTVGHMRWQNIADIGDYLVASTTGNWDENRSYEFLCAKTKKREKLILGLRKSGGIHLGEAEEIIDLIEKNALVRNGFLNSKGGKIKLTRAGRFVANEVCARLLR